MRTIDQVIAALPRPNGEPLPAPRYGYDLTVSGEKRRGISDGPRVGLAVESMRRHMTDEGWQLFQALEQGGRYDLFGLGLRTSYTGMPLVLDPTNVREIVDKMNPSVVVLQDKREYEGRTATAGFDQRERFTNVEALAARPDVFKLTVLKDSHSRPEYHRGSAAEIGCHAWIVYYHPRIVCHLAPYLRSRHLVRTWHTVDPGLVPPFLADRPGLALLSGALSGAYPLRTRLYHEKRRIPGLDVLPHPGYGRSGCATPEYLKTLSKYKVAVCTCSIYGYALRKIVEATACGCVVITDLPVDEEMPGGIDNNLVRITPGVSVSEFYHLLHHLWGEWDPARQEMFAERAKEWYDYRATGKRLADDIETMRRGYND